MAYQKTKNVETAQKYLHQGKIAQAVAEYLVVLKHEPKDQITLMTVGDLFVRQGETFQALEYFERLAQIYLADGFLTKAIAIYKKITKLAPEEMRPIERLADLYVQQGVMSEARPIYLQMADMHQRANRPAQAVGLLRKLLDAEPDNARVQSRLADLLTSTSQPAEALNVLRTAAQQLLRRGDHAEALKFVDRALKIEPADAGTLALRARVLVGSGQQSEAVGMLESLPDVDAGGETSGLLVELYLDAGETPRAAELAERIFAREPKQHSVVVHVASALLDRNETERTLALLRLVQAAVLESGDHEKFSELLARVVEALPGQLEPLESLVAVYKHTSDSFRLPDALVHLAEAYETAGRLDPAIETYEQFLEREPENEAVRRKLERLQARLGLAGQAAPAETPAAAQPVELAEPAALEPAAPPAPAENLDQETQLFVGQAITDVDLYSSYGLTQKALELLEIVLQRAPDHPQALERLLDLSLGLGDDARSVEMASRLEKIYTECGDKAAADRFSDLRRRFERATANPAQKNVPAPAAAPSAAVVPQEAAPLPAAPIEFQIPVVDAMPEMEAIADDAFQNDAVAAAPAVHEVDLSEEWAALSVVQAEPAPPAAEIVKAADEVDSLLNDQAGDDLSELLPDEAAAAPDSCELLDPAPDAPLSPADLPEEMSAPATPVVDAVPDSLAEEILNAYEIAMDKPAAAPVNGGARDNIDSFMRSVSAELDAILPAQDDAPSEQSPARFAPIESAPAAGASSHQGPLGDLFEEFRAEMGESGEKEDPETHYNLGIAYREMGLVEESISEFQKVARAHQQGPPFRYAMQCYTLLALAFAEKGQPSIAVHWYERALLVPGLDPETVLALRYDLGVSQEMAGDMESAHKSFSQVYGTNIDYRDVADRLAALGRTR